MNKVKLTRSDLKVWIDKQGYNGHQINLAGKPSLVLDALGEFGRHYEVPGLPATFFIGRDGTLQSFHMGEISREGLVAAIQKLQVEGNDTGG